MGKTSKAKRLFEKSIRIAKQQSAQYELAKSRISLARLNASPDAGPELAKCESEMQEFQRRIQRGIEQISDHNIDCNHLGPQR